MCTFFVPERNVFNKNILGNSKTRHQIQEIWCLDVVKTLSHKHNWSSHWFRKPSVSEILFGFTSFVCAQHLLFPRVREYNRSCRPLQTPSNFRHKHQPRMLDTRRGCNLWLHPLGRTLLTVSGSLRRRVNHFPKRGSASPMTR